MTDRELLEAAAKAEGIRLHHWSDLLGFIRVRDDMDDDGPVWNPLESDGDALRLAVKLRMSIDYREDGTVNAQCESKNVWTEVLFEPCGADPCAATRRAIVRAAAEIGKDV